MCSDNYVKAENFIRSGDEHYSKASYKMALNDYKQADELCPDKDTYKYKTGKTFLALGKIKEASVYFSSALLLNHQNAEYNNGLAYIFYITGDMEKAREYASIAVNLSPQNSLFMHNLCTIKMELLSKQKDTIPDDIDTIALDYEKAGIKDLDVITVSENFARLAMLFFRKGCLEKSMTWFRKALELNKQNPEFYVNTGAVYLLEGNYEEAKVEFKKALELNSDFIAAHRGLALCYDKEEQVAMAILEYEKLLKIKPSDKHSRSSLDRIYYSLKIKNMTLSFLNLGRIYLGEGELEKALYEFQNIINIGGEIFELIPELNLLGELMIIRGKYGEALNIYEKSASLLNKLYGKLKEKYMKSGEFAESYRLFSLVKADTERIHCYRMVRTIYYEKNLFNMAEYWEYHLKKAICDINTNLTFYGLSQKEELLSEIEQSIKIFSDEPDCLLSFANCLYETGKYKEACQIYGDILVINSSEVIKNKEKLYVSLAKCQDMNGFKEKCLKTIELKPRDGGCYFLLGEILLKEGRIIESIRAYEYSYRLSGRKMFLKALAGAYGLHGLDLYKKGYLIEGEPLLQIASRYGDKNIVNKSMVTLGIIYYRWNNLEKAREFFLHFSDNLTCSMYLGIIYEKLSCYDEAAFYNRKFLAELNKNPYCPVRGSLSSACYPLKEIDAVIEEYERAIELEPDNRSYYKILTEIYDDMQRLDELSNKFYRKLPGNLLYGVIFIHTGQIYCKNKLLQKAEHEYEKSLQAGLMTEELALAVNELGMKYYEEGNIDRAIERFNRAIEIYKYCSDAYYNLGNIFLRKGSIEQAITCFIESVENEKNNQKRSKFLNTLGFTYLKSGDFKSAFTQFKKAVEVNPSCEKHDMFLDDNRALSDKVTMLKALEGDPNYYMAIKCLRDAYKGNMDMEKYCNLQITRFLKTKLSDKMFIDTISIPEELEDLLTEYEKNMTLSREDGKYFKKLGRLYLKEGKPDKALLAIQKATALNPEFAYLYIELSNEYFEANRVEEARLAADKAIEVGMKTLDLASVCIKIGNKLSLSSDWDGANSEYERAWNMDCRNKELAMKINKIGVEFSSIGRLDEAIENFKKSIIILPDNFIFHKNLGTIYQRKGMIKEAIKSFEQALSIEEDDIKVMEKLKNACLEGGYLINGIKILEKLLKFRPDDFNYIFSSGRMYQELGKYKIAIEYYRKTIEKKPDWHSPYAWLAFIYLDQNKYGEGRKNLEIALKLHPKSPKSLLGMARIHFLYGELNLSEEFYSKAIEIYDEETRKKDVSSETYINFGDLYFYKMDIDMAIDKYKKALEIKEECPSAMLRLGKSLIVKGEICEAELQLNSLAGHNVEFPELYLYLGDIYRMKGLLKDSIEYYRKVIRLNPDWVYRAYENLGDLYREMNEENLSIKCYHKTEEFKFGNLPVNSVTLSSMDIKTFIQTIEKDLKR